MISRNGRFPFERLDPPEPPPNNPANTNGGPGVNGVVGGDVVVVLFVVVGLYGVNEPDAPEYPPEYGVVLDPILLVVLLNGLVILLSDDRRYDSTGAVLRDVNALDEPTMELESLFPADDPENGLLEGRVELLPPERTGEPEPRIWLLVEAVPL